MVFLDSNVAMYLIGATHPLKQVAQRIVSKLVGENVRLVSSAEVLQEILHRYQAIQRLDAIQAAFDVMHELCDDIFPITTRDVNDAKQLVLAYPTASARDALHVAVMKNLGIKRIFSFDKDLDAFMGIERLFSADR